MFKKIILAALVVASAVFAQSNPQIDVKFGGRAAFNYGGAWGENSDKFGLGWGPGFTLGLDVKFAATPSIFIVTGLEYDYRTINWDLGKLISSYENELSGSMSRSQREMFTGLDWTYSLGYLNIPVFVRFYAAPQFFIDAGAYVGFNVSSTMDLSYEDRSASQDTPSKMQKDADFGIIAGLGYSVSPRLDLYFRYTMGFADMVDIVKIAALEEDDVDMSDAPNVGFKNMRFQIGATFWFN